jgi:ribosomal protein RSM22 (predicted rRNA methylase)
LDLPPDLRTALEQELTTLSPKGLTSTVEQLSQRYRKGHVSSNSGREQTFLHSPADVLAYASYRLPATFAAIYAALTHIQERRPDWYPCTLLDVGAGPGTAMWAATTLWPDLEKITLLERDQHMIALGKRLAQHARSTALQEAIWQKADLLKEWDCQRHELVIAAYMLGELPFAKHEDFIKQLWALSTDTLLIVEPGTPRGFSLIRRVREQLIAEGAFMIAPCPHSLACPMPENDWCHFAQRVARTRVQRNVKGGTLGYEDEKFSYVAVSRESITPAVGRVIRHPQQRSGHIYLELCTPQGLERSIVTRSDREAFREARDLKWGSGVSANVSESSS